MVTTLIDAVYKDGRKQGEIARSAGIPPSTLSRILNGNVTPQQRTIFRLADALNVDRDSLIGIRRKGGVR